MSIYLADGGGLTIINGRYILGPMTDDHRGRLSYMIGIAKLHLMGRRATGWSDKQTGTLGVDI